MCFLTKFGDYTFCRNGYVNHCINSYMTISEKVKLTALIWYFWEYQEYQFTITKSRKSLDEGKKLKAIEKCYALQNKHHASRHKYPATSCFSSITRAFLQFSRIPKEIGIEENFPGKPSQNILRLHNVLLYFPFTISEMELHYSHQKMNAYIVSQIAEQLSQDQEFRK